jgi:hypothetical protein
MTTPSSSSPLTTPRECPFCGELPIQDDADGIWFIHDSPSDCVLDGNRFTLAKWNHRHSLSGGLPEVTPDWYPHGFAAMLDRALSNSTGGPVIVDRATVESLALHLRTLPGRRSSSVSPAPGVRLVEGRTINDAADEEEGTPNNDAEAIRRAALLLEDLKYFESGRPDLLREIADRIEAQAARPSLESEGSHSNARRSQVSTGDEGPPPKRQAIYDAVRAGFAAGVDHPHLRCDSEAPHRFAAIYCKDQGLDSQLTAGDEGGDAARLAAVLRTNTPWPLVDVLRHYEAAAAHLMGHHDCDCDSYETLIGARVIGRELIALLTADAARSSHPVSSPAEPTPRGTKNV